MLIGTVKLTLRVRPGRRIAAAMAILFLAAEPLSAAPRRPRRVFTVQDLGTFEGSSAQASSFNDLGQAVGVVSSGSVPESFLWDSGVWTNLGRRIAVDINNHGQILLQDDARVPEDAARCYVLDGGMLDAIPTPAGWQCHAADLNDAGEVVGSYSAFSQGLYTTRGFLWSAGTLTELGDLGGDTTLPMRLNERGQVVGGASTPSGYEMAFLWEAGTIRSLVPAGPPGSRATAINDRGDILVQNGAHVLLVDGFGVSDLGTMGAPDTPNQLTVPLDLNDRGQILVAVEDAGTHVFAYFIWSDGRRSPLPSLGSGRPSAVRLNDLGQAIGNDRPDDESPWHLAMFSTVTPRGRRAR